MNCPSCARPLDDASRFCKFCGAATQPTAPEDPSFSKVRAGDVFEGKWRIEAKLGQGGMGAVFLAHDESLDRKVAIKILAGELCNDEEFVVRFEREAKLTANLEHPNIVPVYAVGKFGVRPFIVMKMLEGATLSRHLRQYEGGMPVEELLPIMRQLCDGLGFIHSKGFVHRDIKSGNIIISSTGHATILDFGILRDTNQTAGLTRAGVMMGTPHYMSPEQALGKSIDQRADLYALGCLIYELLIGKTPFLADNDFQIISAHVKSPPPDPRELRPSLPAGITAVIEKALAKTPADRYQTAAELFQSLESALKPTARRTTRTATAAAVPAPGTGSSRTTTGRRGSFTLGTAADSTDRATPVPAKRPTRPSQRLRAPIQDSTEETPDLSAADTPTPPRMQRPPAEPRPEPLQAASGKVDVEPPKKSGGGITTLLIVIALGALGFLAFRAMHEATSGTEEISTGLQPISPPEEPGEGPPPHLAGTAPVEPDAHAEPPAEPATKSPPTPDAPGAGQPQPTLVASGEPSNEPAAAPAAESQAESQPQPDVANPKPREAKREPRKVPDGAKPPGTTVKADTTAKLAGAGDVGSLRVVTTHNSEALWATLFFDGKRKGDTPLTFDVPAGKHTIAVERGGFKRIEQQVTVAPGNVTVVKLELVKDGP